MKLTYFKNLIRCGTLIILGAFLSENVQAQQPEFTHDILQIYDPALFDNHSFNIIDGDLYFTSSSAELGIYSNGEYIEINLYNEIGYQVPSEFVKVDDRIYFKVRTTTSDYQLAMLKDGVVTKVTDFPSGSSMTYLTALDGSVLFRANGGVNGRELWRHDGTTLTEYDIQAGSEDSYPNYFTVYNNEILFIADDGTHGTELWRYTTATGPEMVMDLYDGATGGVQTDPQYEEFDNKIYISGRTATTGYELYAYDGTTITLADDIVSGTGGSVPKYLAAYNGGLYFEADDNDVAGRELYVFDGTSTSLVADIYDGVSGSTLRNLVAAGDFLFFTADDGTNGYELYVYDGENTTLVDINDGGDSNASRLAAYNGKIYFTATDGDNTRLWQHDGTTLTDMADLGSDCFSQRYIVPYGDKLYYTGYGGTNQSGYHPWVFDGTEASLIVTSARSSGSDLEGEFAELNGKIYFSANDDIYGGELWVYDGQTSSLVADLYEGDNGSYPIDLTVYNDKLYFFAEVFYEGVDYGDELVEYDGTDINIIDINEGTSGSGSFMPGMNVYNNKLYFRASDGTNGFELWQYDGTTASMAADIESGAGSSSPGFFQEYNGKLYFQANTTATGKELWSYDGSTASLVEDLVDGGHSSPTSLTVANGKLFFAGTTQTSGSELFVYDGTTIIEYDINESGDGYPQNLTAFNDKLVFAATDGSVAGTAGRELWVTDGSSAEALEQFNINASENGSSPTDFIEFNGALYFSANDGTTGQELWKYDGTNVTQVHDIFPGDNNSGLSNSESLGVIGPYLYMGATEEEGNVELYRTDGTTLELVADIGGESGQSYPWGFFPTEDYLYFIAQDHRGEELWKIRRTSEETDMLTFSITDQAEASTINATSHTVTVEMPFGTDLSELIPSFTISDYAEVSPASDVIQDFSGGAVTYTITAEFGNVQEWQVNVVEGAASTETDILTFELDEQTGDATIDAIEHTVSVEVAYGTDLSSLSPTISISTGASISPQGAQNLSEAFTYTVTAEDSETEQEWIVTVSVAPSNETDIVSFALAEQTSEATISAENHTVSMEVAYGTDLTSLIPTITVSAGATISPSGAQDFSQVVTYTVTAENETATQAWSVTVTEAASNETDILTFELAAQTREATISAADHTVSIEVANGTDLTDLEPTITVSAGASISPSGAQDFSESVTYTVTAENGTATQDWSVTVTEAPSNATDILTFELAEQTGAAIIDATNHTIAVEVEFGTDLSSLEPTVTVSDGATLSPSGAQDFSGVFTYTVTAEDEETSQEWVVTVTEAENEEVLVVADLAVQPKLYPNPATDQLQVEGLSGITAVDFFDLSGQLVLSKNINNKGAIELNAIKPGLYQVRFTNDKISTTTRLLIRR